MDVKLLPVTQLKPRLLKAVSQAQKLGQEFVITKNGKPAAVLLGFDEWENWRETIEILADSQAMRRIRKNLSYFRRRGKGKSVDEVFG